LPFGPTTGWAQGNFVAHVSWKVQFNSHSAFHFLFVTIVTFSPLSSIVRSTGSILKVLRLDELETPLTNAIGSPSTTTRTFPLLD